MRCAVPGALLLGHGGQVLPLGKHLAANTKKLLKIAADDCLDLRSRQTVRLTGLNQCCPLLIERRLRCQQIEKRRRTKRVTLLLHAQVFLG